MDAAGPAQTGAGLLRQGVEGQSPPVQMLQGVCVPRDQVPVGPQLPSWWPLVEGVGQVPRMSFL